MEDGDTQDPTDEMEIGQMFGIDGRIRIDLQRINVVARVLKQSLFTAIFPEKESLFDFNLD